jgi:hypothetical protein
MTLAADIRKFCEAHYEEGYDAVVECWDESDMQEFIDEQGVTDVDDFVSAYAPIRDYRKEIMSTAF